jgi:predicted nucleic acid-binding protein
VKTVYVDSSVVLRLLLGQPRPLAGWGKWQRAYASEVLGLEARRTIDRLRLAGAYRDDDVAAAQDELRRIEATLGRIALSRPVLRRAALPMATAVRTLDAIHLASALLLAERRRGPVVFATHDTRQAAAARALGFDCVGV